MNWRTVPVRLPEEVFREIDSLVRIINQGEEIPVSANEMIVELLRESIGRKHGQANFGAGYAPNKTEDPDSYPSTDSKKPDRQPRRRRSPAREPRSRTKNAMTLHEAMHKVLLEADRPMTFGEVREAIIDQGLYRQGDGDPPSHQQVRSRVSHYPQLFEVNTENKPHTISARDPGNSPDGTDLPDQTATSF